MVPPRLGEVKASRRQEHLKLVIDPPAPGRHLALVTCRPLNSVLPGPLRYVVYADLIT
ncbi:MAG TPA: hypothetical protein VKT99_05705 [Xanthobacteraceae bacterium]|nr:hypothetical protein [Xanthobacteraceae bacterium]